MTPKFAGGETPRIAVRVWTRDLVMGPVARRIGIELGADYKKAHQQVLEALDGQRYFRLVETLEAFPASAALTKTGQQAARKVIPKLIKRDTKRLRNAARDAKLHSIPPAPVTTLPCTKPARTANACGTRPRQHRPSTRRKVRNWWTPPMR